jgi:glycine/D-amino acid oxidase-like deaminating enzyme
MRAIIVGGGVMGLGTAWALARDGHDVELFEQGPLPNPLASSMDEHRLIRHPYGDHTGYARLIDEAYAAWNVLWSDLGQRLYAPTGTLALTANGANWAQRSAASLATIGRPMIELDLAELPRRFPMLNSRDVEHAYWIDSGGVLFADDIVSRLAQHLATRPTVRLHDNVPIRAVDLDRAKVTSDSGVAWEGDVVVVAAGAWIGRLLPALSRRLVPSRQVVVYFRLPEEARAAWSKGPMVIDKTGEVGLYLVPPAEGRAMKIGDHEFSRLGDPDFGREASTEEVRPLLDRCRSLLAGFERWRVERLKVCFYTVTEDERFVVEKLGAKGWVMSPCSGHGFKFGALMSQELARTITMERDPVKHARWAAGREGDTK